MAGIYDIVIVGGLIGGAYLVLTSGILDNINIGGNNTNNNGTTGGDTGGIIDGGGDGVTVGGGEGVIPTGETGGNTTGGGKDKIVINTGGNTGGNTVSTASLQSKCSSTCKSKYPGMLINPKWSNNNCYCNVNYSGTCAAVCKSKYPGQNRKPRLGNDGRTCFCDKPTSTTTTTKPPVGCGCKVNAKCNTVGGTASCQDCCCKSACASKSCGSNQVKAPYIKNGTCYCCKSKTTTTSQSSGCTCPTNWGVGGCSNVGTTGSNTCRSCCCTKLCAKNYPGRKARLGANGTCYCDVVKKTNMAIHTYKYSDNHNIPYAYTIKRERSAADMVIAI